MPLAHQPRLRLHDIGRGAPTGSMGREGPPTPGPSSQSSPSHRIPSRMPVTMSADDRSNVGVFDAEDEGAAVPPRVQPVEERGARAADVQVARWATEQTLREGARRHYSTRQRLALERIRRASRWHRRRIRVRAPPVRVRLVRPRFPLSRSFRDGLRRRSSREASPVVRRG